MLPWEILRAKVMRMRIVSGWRTPWTGGTCKRYNWSHFLVHTISTNSQANFGTPPKNMDEEDMVELNVSTLNILKAQHACKAAARHQAEEQSETKSETEPETPPQTSPTLNAWHSTPPLTSTSTAGHQLHWAPSSEPPRGHPSQAYQQPHAWPSTPPLTSASAAGHQLHQAPSSEPPQHPSQASES